MKNLSKIALLATVFFVLTTVFIAILGGYLLSNFDMQSLDHSLAVANELSTSIQMLRDMVIQLGHIVHGLVQAAKGALEVAIGIGTIASALFALIYRKTNTVNSSSNNE